MKVILSISIFVFCFYSIGSSQIDINSEDPIESAINEISDRFQEFILTSDLSELKTARESIKKLASTGASYDTLYRIINYINNKCKKKCQLEDVKEAISKKYPESKVPSVLSEKDLYSLRYIGEPTIKLIRHFTDYTDYTDSCTSPGITRKDEVEFFDIQDGESILEIGSGIGTDALINCALHSQCDIYLNELSERKIIFAKAFFAWNKDLTSKNSIHFFQGSKKHTGTDVQVDKIIMVNTYHHFKKQKQMLKSIKKNLKPDGIVYLSEHVKLKGESACRHALPTSEIIYTIVDQGFVLIEKQSDGKDVLLSFKVREE